LVAYDFPSWLDRFKGVLTRSGKRLLVLVLSATMLPGLVLGGGIALALSSGSAPWVVSLAIFTVGLVWLYFISATGLAGMKVMTSDAAGDPVRVRRAFRTSLRLALPTSGWILMAVVAFIVGGLACFLPAVYVMVVFTLLLPAMAFERADGLTRSRELVHRNFWPTAGRFAFVGVALNLVLFPMLFLSTFLLGGFEVSPDQAAAAQETFQETYQAALTQGWPYLIPQILFNTVGYVVWLAAILVTYVELRARSESDLTTARLAADMDA
jgi:MFS family permease